MGEMKNFTGAIAVVLCAASLLGCGTGSSVNTSPLVFSSLVGATSGDTATSANTAVAITQVKTIQGHYLVDNVDCDIQISQTLVNQDRLNSIRSKGNSAEFVITLSAGETPPKHIDILDIPNAGRQQAQLTFTDSGTFTTISIVDRSCGFEFVQGGGTAKCNYADVPALCTWTFVKATSS